MRTPKPAFRLIACLIGLIAADVLAQPDIGLGLPLEEAAPGLTVFPDGRGLPPGRGSVVRGEALYRSHCQACHGVGGVGGINDRLVGGQVALDRQPSVRTIGSYWPYATSVFDYVRRTMPYNAPGSLSDADTYAIVAYLFHLNGLVGASAVLDRDTLRRLELPNRERFFSEYDLP